MTLADFLATWRGLTLENRLHRLAVLGLLGTNLVRAGPQGLDRDRQLISEIFWLQQDVLHSNNGRYVFTGPAWDLWHETKLIS